MAVKILQQIIRNVKETKFLTLMVDETPDPAHQEQISCVLHHGDPKCTVQERFIGVHEVILTDRQFLEQAMRDVFVKHGSELENTYGQSYNGAASMSGKYTGL